MLTSSLPTNITSVVQKVTMNRVRGYETKRMELKSPFFIPIYETIHKKVDNPMANDV